MMSQNRSYYEDALGSKSQSKEDIFKHFLISFELCSTKPISILTSKFLMSDDGYTIITNTIDSDLPTDNSQIFEFNFNKAMTARLKAVMSKYLEEKELTAGAFIEFIMQQMIEFAEEVNSLLKTISFDEKCKEFNELISNLNNIWRDDLGVELHSLDLYYFRQEVKRAESLDINTFSPKQKASHKEFVTKLNEFDQFASESLQREIMPNNEYYSLFEFPGKKNTVKVKDILKARECETNQLLKKTTSMLSQLGYQQTDKEKDAQELYTFKQQIESSKAVNFTKSLVSLAFAGIGFILGIPFGIVTGILSAPLLGTIGLKQLYTMPYNGAVLGKNIGERLTGRAPQSISNLLFFKSPAEAHVTRIQKAGNKFLADSPQEKQGEINYETLSHYFSLR